MRGSRHGIQVLSDAVNLLKSFDICEIIKHAGLKFLGRRIEIQPCRRKVADDDPIEPPTNVDLSQEIEPTTLQGGFDRYRSLSDPNLTIFVAPRSQLQAATST
jgi:hypothetical protein